MGQLCEIGLAGNSASVQKARSFVEVTLAAWGMAPYVEQAMLLTSELATNAVTHARTSFRLTVLLDDRVTIEVWDASPELPCVDSARVDDDRGRGLVLVEKLAASWGVRREDHGKTVWFSLDTAPPAEARAGLEVSAPDGLSGGVVGINGV
jgi:anti-sigma regulatory factor (Ser/Thr protein kinase)